MVLCNRVYALGNVKSGSITGGPERDLEPKPCEPGRGSIRPFLPSHLICFALLLPSHAHFAHFSYAKQIQKSKLPLTNHGRRSRRRPFPGSRHITVEICSVAAVSAHAGQNDAACPPPLDRVSGGGCRLCSPRVLDPRLLHRLLRPRHLHPQPPHRLPFPSGRSRDSRRPYPPHPRIR